MMKNIFNGIVFLVSLSPVAVMADYQGGRDAFDRGDYPTAVKEFKTLAKQNDPRGQYALAVMYDLGEGVPQNDTAAVKWYTLAADQNYALAQYALGVMYSKGNAALRDYKRAYMWYDIASSNGVVKGILHKKDIAKGMTPPQIEEAKKMSLRYFKNIHADV